MTIFLHREGDPSCPPLLLLHSGGMTHKEWQPQFSIFSKDYNVLAPDLPGHGCSRLGEGDSVSIKAYTESIIQLLQDNDIEKIHVLGSSTGAAIALYMSIYHPETVDRLVLYRMGYAKNTDAYEETKRIASPKYWESYGMDKWMSNQHIGQSDDENEAKNEWKKVISRVAMLFAPETTDHNHSIETLKTIMSKTLIIAGDRDPLVPVQTVLSMSEAIPDSAVWILPNASHVTATNTWRAKAFAEEVRRFLSS